MTVVSNRGYRLQTITRFVNVEDGRLITRDEPISYGLGLEVELENPEDINKSNWEVICFIKYNEDSMDEDCFIEPITDRFLDDVDSTSWDLVRQMLKAGVELVRAANTKFEYNA